MFNTSTLITLGLTALLCGIIMFYCKRKFAEYEQKLNVMSDLISNIITQLNQIPPSVYDNSSFAAPGFNGEDMPANITMNVMPPHVEEEDSDDEENDDEDNNNEEKRIIVDLGNNYQDESNTINLSEEPLEEDSWDSEESDDEDDSNKISIQETDLNVVVESEPLGSNDSHVIQGVAQEMANTIVKEVTDAIADQSQNEVEEEIKVIDTNAPVEVDYSKMQVAMLKKMVAERKLAQGVSKLKKQELVDILMNKSQ